MQTPYVIFHLSYMQHMLLQSLSFLFSYFGNKFVSTNSVHDNFIMHQLQALSLALFVSVVQLEFLGRFKIMVIPNIRFLAPVFYKLTSSNQQLNTGFIFTKRLS